MAVAPSAPCGARHVPHHDEQLGEPGEHRPVGCDDGCRVTARMPTTRVAPRTSALVGSRTARSDVASLATGYTSWPPHRSTTFGGTNRKRVATYLPFDRAAPRPVRVRRAAGRRGARGGQSPWCHRGGSPVGRRSIGAAAGSTLTADPRPPHDEADAPANVGPARPVGEDGPTHAARATIQPPRRAGSDGAAASRHPFTSCGRGCLRTTLPIK